MSKFTDSLIGENLEVATEYFKSVMASSNMEKDSKTGKTKKSGGSIGFIPFNINFKMDGLSGIKIYNELVFDTSFLPPGYSTTLDFIVTGVDHQLKNGDWETDVKVTLVPKTDESSTIVTGSISVNAQKESYTPPPVVAGTGTGTGPGSGTTIIASKSLKEVLIAAGYAAGTFKYEFALIIGTKEGYIKGSSNRPSRNNNPGNISFSSELTSLDPGAILEPPNAKGEQRFAKFSTPELGAKALVEKFIKKWANGNYPGTIVNGPSAASDTYRSTWGVPNSLKAISGKGEKLTIEQFMYIYGPPSENNTENYITQVINSLKTNYPTITRTSKLIDFIDK